MDHSSKHSRLGAGARRNTDDKTLIRSQEELKANRSQTGVKNSSHSLKVESKSKIKKHSHGSKDAAGHRHHRHHHHRHSGGDGSSEQKNQNHLTNSPRVSNEAHDEEEWEGEGSVLSFTKLHWPMDLEVGGEDYDFPSQDSVPQPQVEQEEIDHENIHRTLLEKESVAPEIFVVWEHVSKYVIEKLLEGVAVRIPGLGTFSYVVMPNDITATPAGGRFLLRKGRKFPVFKICPHLEEMYRLQQENFRHECNIPVMAFNTAAAARAARMKSSTFEAVMLETLQSFVTGIVTKKDIEFPFPLIGKLYIHSGSVFMLFYHEFCVGMDFEFAAMPSYISSVIPGNMTPLCYHKPKPGYHSVFHYNEMRSVGNALSARPKPYAGGRFYQATDVSKYPCEFQKNLFNQSNLIYDCACCESKNYEPCGFSKNYDRIQRACCTTPGAFVFQRPDGSSFTPNRLYQPSKVGNPILDRLADDKCLLHQAIGCWMHKKVMNTLGKETIARHYNRSYFHRDQEEDRKNTGLVKRSFLEKPDTPEPRSRESSTLTGVTLFTNVPSPEQSLSMTMMNNLEEEEENSNPDLVSKSLTEIESQENGEGESEEHLGEEEEAKADEEPCEE